MKRTRREFLRDAAAFGAGAWVVSACGSAAKAGAMQSANAVVTRPSLDNAGIQLFTVRDRLGPRFEETLAALAAIGYREVEPFTYNDWTPEQIRGMLDRTGIRAPSTHVELRPGPDLERTLAGFQL